MKLFHVQPNSLNFRFKARVWNRKSNETKSEARSLSGWTYL